jgi:hypothetical protein
LIWGCDPYGTDFKSLNWEPYGHRHEASEKPAAVLCATRGFLIGARSEVKGDENMLGLIAAVLIILWLLGFLAFHVSTGLIHVLLIIGIIMLLLHFFRGRSATS